MVMDERVTRGRVLLRLVANNGQPVPPSSPAPVDAPHSRAGDSWYHEEAVQQEKAVRERKPH